MEKTPDELIDEDILDLDSVIENDELDLGEEENRKYVATPLIASKLIESVLMDVPIPVIYLAEEKNDTYSVIDGHKD